jgi:hypothetical protein
VPPSPRRRPTHERRAIKGPIPSAYVPRVWEIVREDPRDATALEALAWLVEESRSPSTATRRSRRSRGTTSRARTSRPVLEASARTSRSVRSCSSSSRPRTPTATCAAAALYARRRHQLESRADRAEAARARGPGLEGYKRWLGRTGRTLSAAIPRTLEEDARRRSTASCASSATCAAQRARSRLAREADLRELRDLTVGKAAPEIAGEDLDGVAFRLSDYRGKVVLLDFWGNW